MMMEEDDDSVFTDTPFPAQLSVLEQFDFLERAGKIMNRTATCEVMPYFGGEFPVYMAMANFRVTPSGFTKPVTDLFYKILMMCGEISTSLTEHTTHLLACHTYTVKVETARNWRLPIITVDWVENLWSACQQRGNPYLHGSQPEFRIPPCPLFHNLKFVLSPLFGDANIRDFSKILMKFGGNMRKGVKRSNIYFYICLEEEDTALFKEAQALGVKCIRPAWVNQAIRTHHLPAASKFQIKIANGWAETLVRENSANPVGGIVQQEVSVNRVQAPPIPMTQETPTSTATSTATATATSTMATPNNNNYDAFADFDYFRKMEVDMATDIDGISVSDLVPLGMSMRQMCATVEDLTGIGQNDTEGILL